MTQRTLFPTKWLLKLNRKQPVRISDDEFFAWIPIVLLYLGFFLVFIGSYANEIGERIPRKPQLEREAINLVSRFDTLYTRAIILKRTAESMEYDMDEAYQRLYTPLKDWGNKSYYNYYYLEVGNE